VDPGEPQVLGAEAEEEQSRGAGDYEVLHAFYQHLGATAVGAGTEAAEWVEPLARAGYAELADGWENLELLRDNPSAYADGLLELCWKTGEHLRALHEPALSLDEALEGWERLPEPAQAARSGAEVTHEYDVRRLVSLLRGGGLRERRAAAVELGDFLVHRRKLASEELYQLALAALTANRDPSITLEVTESLSGLGGAEARRAKAGVEKVGTIFARLADRVQRYWDGAIDVDPVDDLPSGDLVSMGIWLRRAPDYIAGHLAEYLLARLGKNETGALASLTSALVPSGDPRLLPVLVRVLQDAGYEARVAAIKALAHIDDPRSAGALAKAYRHASDALERVMIGRALATFGEFGAAEEIVSRIDDSSPSFVREEALKAVGMLPDVDSGVVEKIVTLVGSPAPAIAVAALRALSHLGDASTVELLEGTASESATLRAAALRASGDLRARLALLGEEGIDRPASELRPSTGRRPGFVARLRSVLWYLVGVLFVALRRWQQARRAAARASRINPSSAKGHFLEGYVWVQVGRDESAIESYRQGLQKDPLFPVRQWGEADRVLGAYLRQAEVLGGRQGRRDEAIALLEETEFIDLRGADPNLKIEVDRRLDSLKLERRRERLAAEKE
jgi:tetratricopeptide (TPR) repeat protein